MKTEAEPFQRAVIAAACLTALLLSSQGMKVGLPSREVIALSFADGPQFEAGKKAFVSSREEVYAHYGSIARHDPDILSHAYVPDTKKLMRVDLPGGALEVSQAVIHRMRGRFLRSTLPDEELLIASLQKIRPERFQFNPHLFQYGGVYIYFCGFLLWMCAKLGLLVLSSDITAYLNDPNLSALIYAVPKYANAFFFALSVWPFHRLCRRLFRPSVSALLAFSYAVTPVFIIETHSLKPYIFCLPALLMAFDSALAIASGEKQAYKAAGVWAGLATGTLWLCGYALIAVGAAHLLRPRRQARDLAAFMALCVAVFLLVNPYWLLAPREALGELLRLEPVAAHAYSLAKWAGYLSHRGAAAVGWPLWLSFLAGVVVCQRSPDRRKFVLLCPFVFYWLYTAGKHYANSHYAVPMFPLCLVVSGYAFEALWQARARLARLRWALAPVVVGGTLLQSIFFVSLMRAPAPDLEAGAWMNANIPSGSSVALESSGMFPPFRCLDYRVRMVASTSELAPGDYYIRTGGSEEPALGAGEGLVALASFRRKVWLDALFSAREVFWLDTRFEVYRKT